MGFFETTYSTRIIDIICSNNRQVKIIPYLMGIKFNNKSILMNVQLSVNTTAF